MKINKISLFLVITICLLLIIFILALGSLLQTAHLPFLPIKMLMILAAFILSFQGIFTLFWMLYGWEDPEKMKQDSPPAQHLPPQLGFTLLVPARFESQVIVSTIKSLAMIEYPLSLVEVLILCKADDHKTIVAANQTIQQYKLSQCFRTVVFTSDESSKPSALNIGLAQAKHEIVGVFDAEDEPNPKILLVVNTLFVLRQPAVVQGGVQLMNYRTNWFSLLNVLEYYFWYKSALHLFSRMKVVPLGGNTVFFRKLDLQAAHGWAECLTEDADIGLRFSMQEKKIQIMYEPDLVTKEESPATLKALLKQRTRWNQGFFQILMDRKWLGFSDLKRRLFAAYFLSMAQINAFNFCLIILSFLTFFIHLPIFATLLVMFPLYLLMLQLLTQLLGYYEFTKEYHLPLAAIDVLRIVIGFMPYQMLLALGAFRAVIRQLRSQDNWEKTTHQNLHRTAYL